MDDPRVVANKPTSSAAQAATPSRRCAGWRTGYGNDAAWRAPEQRARTEGWIERRWVCSFMMAVR